VRRLAVGALCLVTVAGCAARPSPVIDTRPLPQAEGLVNALTARRASIHSLRALARLAYTAPGESRRARQVILAARPDRLRFEVLSPFGAVFVLTASDGRLAAYARGEGTVYRGMASRENFERYAAVDLPVASAVDLLLGTPPVRERGNGVVSREDGQIKLWQHAGDDVQARWFTTTLDLARYEQQDEQGHVLLRATYTQYADVDGIRLPTQLRLELPATQRRVDIEFREPEVNPILADALFALETPPGSKEINLDQAVN